MDEKFSKMIRPLAGILLLLILLQGASGSQKMIGTDWDLSHKHVSHLLMMLAFLMPVVTIKSEVDDSSIKGNSFAIAGIAALQFGVGTYMMKGDWSWGWLHIPLGMMMAAHVFAILILTRRVLEDVTEVNNS
jgi:hypothetical protein